MTTREWLSDPVAITGANGHVGRHVGPRLERLGNQVRPLIRSDDWEGRMEGVEVVIHLAGTLQPRRPNTYRAANLGTVQRLINALTPDSLQRIVFLSYPGANPRSSNAYLRSKGEAEELIISTGIPSVIFRAAFIYGEHDDVGPSFANYLGRAGETVSVLGDGTEKLAPIHVDDLADMMIGAAVDPGTPTGTFDVGGPDVMALDDFVRRLNPPGVGIRHISPTASRLLAHVVPGLSPALVDVLLTDSVPAGDPTETASKFGGSLRSMTSVG